MQKFFVLFKLEMEIMLVPIVLELSKYRIRESMDASEQ